MQSLRGNWPWPLTRQTVVPAVGMKTRSILLLAFLCLAPAIPAWAQERIWFFSSTATINKGADVLD
jgi:hypothetical protein